MEETAVIIAAAVGVLVVLGLIYWFVRGRERQLEIRREQAEEHRQEAAAAAQRAGEKDLIARRHAQEAEAERERAIELEEKAAERDPDYTHR